MSERAKMEGYGTMGEAKKLFDKFGGVNLIKQYARAGVLPFALAIAPLLGFSRKGLELFRLAVQMKTYQKIEKRYANTLANYDKNTDWDKMMHIHEKKVWICWLQGMDNAPFVVQQCYKSVRKYLSDYSIIVLTAENIQEYVSLPDYILEKWKKGTITNTHFSDLLRLAVLNQHGGTWLDATVLCTGKKIPDYMLESKLFFFQVLKPGRDGSTLNVSSWLLTSESNNKILMSVEYLLHEYWKTNTQMLDYFLIHMFMEMACNYYREETNEIIKFSNSIPHILLLDLFEPFDQKKYDAVREMTPFHKLAYKRDKADMEKKGTFFDVIINEGRF